MRAARCVWQNENARWGPKIVTIESIHKWIKMVRFVVLHKIYCEKINFVTPYLFNSLHYLNTTKRFLFFLPFHFNMPFGCLICGRLITGIIIIASFVVTVFIFFLSQFIVLWTKYSSIHLISCRRSVNTMVCVYGMVTISNNDNENSQSLEYSWVKRKYFGEEYVSEKKIL